MLSGPARPYLTRRLLEQGLALIGDTAETPGLRMVGLGSWPSLPRNQRQSASAMQRRRYSVPVPHLYRPATGPASARSRVAVSMSSVPAAARKLCRARAVSHTTSNGRGRPDDAIRR